MKYIEKKKLIEKLIISHKESPGALSEDLGDGTNPQISLAKTDEADFYKVKKAISETYPLLVKELVKLNFEPTYSIGYDSLIPGLRNDEGIYLQLPYNSGSQSSTKFKLYDWVGPGTHFYGIGVEDYNTPEEVVNRIKKLMAAEGKIKKPAEDKAMKVIKVKPRISVNFGSGINEYEILDFKSPFETEFDFPGDREDACTDMIDQAYPKLVRELNRLGFEYEYDDVIRDPDFYNSDLGCEVILPHKNRSWTQKFFEFNDDEVTKKFKTANQLIAFLRGYLEE